MCPIVPTFTCGLLRSNFSFAIANSVSYFCFLLQKLFVSSSHSSSKRGQYLFRPCGTFPLHLGHDFLGHRAGRLFIPREMHRKRCAALRVRAHVGGVAEHLSQRNHRLDYLRSGAMLNALDPSAAAVQVADDRAHKLFRYDHFHRHHRLQQHRARLARGLFERHRTGDLESHSIRVHFVIAAVVQDGLYIDHLVARKYSAFHGFFNALVHRLDVLPGNHAAHDLVDELVALTCLVGLDAELHVTVLAAATGLADVFAFRLRLLANRLAIRYLRLANVGLHVELAHHAVDDDLQVQLAHAADDRLPTVWIGRNLE